MYICLYSSHCPSMLEATFCIPFTDGSLVLPCIYQYIYVCSVCMRICENQLCGWPWSLLASPLHLMGRLRVTSVCSLSEQTSMDVSDMRLLRKSASLSHPLRCWDAQLDLCHAYASGNFGGISKGVGLEFVRQLLHMSKSSYSSKLQKGITINMR